MLWRRPGSRYGFRPYRRHSAKNNLRLHRIRKRVPEHLVLLVPTQLRQARADLLGRAPRRLTLAVELRTRVQRLQLAQPLHQRSFERQHRRDPSTSAARRQPAPAAPRSRPQVFDASIADARRGGVTWLYQRPDCRIDWRLTLPIAAAGHPSRTAWRMCASCWEIRIARKPRRTN